VFSLPLCCCRRPPLRKIPKLAVLGVVFYTANEWSWVFVAGANVLFTMIYVSYKYCACCKGQYVL
jgi:hypothetical protein